MSELELITMPHQIEALTEDTPLIMSQTPVSHFGCHRYRLIVDESDVEKYKSLSAGRLEYTLKAPPPDLHMRHLKDIVTAWIHSKTGISIDTLIKEDNVLIPAKDGEYLYMMPYQARQLTFNFDVCIGYGLLSSSSLAPHGLAGDGLKLGDTQIDTSLTLQVEDLLLYKLDSPLSETHALNFDGQLHTKWSQGHVVIMQSPQFNIKLWLVRELARVWDLDVDGSELSIGSRKSQIISHTAPGVPTGCALKAWLEDSLIRIVDNQPLVIVRHENWFHDVTDDEVNYVIAAAYRKVQDNNPLLVSHEPIRLVGLGLQLPVYDPSDLVIFDTYVRKYITMLPRRKVPSNTVPAKQLILEGTITYDSGLWSVQIKDHSRPLLHHTIDDDEKRMVFQSKLQREWQLGKLMTNWGYHLYTKYGRISVRMT